MTDKLSCPVCGTELVAKIPDFCPVCGWECGTDITLFPSLSEPTEKDRDYYLKNMTLAKQRWAENQELSKKLTEQREQEEKRKEAESRKPKDDEQRIKEEERKHEEQKRIDSESAALKLRIENLIEEHHLNESLKLLGGYDRLKPGDDWSTKQHQLIRESLETPKPKPRQTAPPQLKPKPIAPIPVLSSSKSNSGWLGKAKRSVGNLIASVLVFLLGGLIGGGFVFLLVKLILYLGSQ